ncbi:MAG: polysaccharide deacetylase family protein [Oscillospiraceae bacterium]
MHTIRKLALWVFACWIAGVCLTTPAGAVRLLALTFDDGPHAVYTPQIAAALRARDAKATFFVVGKWLPGKETLVRSLAEDGNQIGNHTTHHVKLIGLTPAEIRRELEQTDAALEEILGQKRFFARPPFGARSPESCRAIPAPVILWSVDPAGGRQLSGAAMAQKVIAKAQDGDIILMHDTTPANLNATILILDTLQKRGFEFVTVNELFRLRGITPQNGVIYKHARGGTAQPYDESKLYQHWAFSSIEKMRAGGYMTGDGTGWHPDGTLSQKAAVTVLWRICGGTAGRSGDAPAWAAERGILPAGGFDAAASVTREQLYAMVAGLVDGANWERKPLSDCPRYGDDRRMTPAAAEPVLLLRQLGFVSQGDGELFRPKDAVTRAEAAELFAWFLQTL